MYRCIELKTCALVVLVLSKKKLRKFSQSKEKITDGVLTGGFKTESIVVKSVLEQCFF